MWLDYKERAKKQQFVDTDKAMPSGASLLALLTEHKGVSGDLVAQMRSLNRGMEVPSSSLLA